MSVRKAIEDIGIKQLQNQGEQFMRYWKTVSEDLKRLAEAMIKNFELMDVRIQNIEVKINEVIKNEHFSEKGRKARKK